MARPRNPPQPDRYPACARCGQAYPTAARWPDGDICRHCYLAAQRTRGHCRCGHQGVLPGRAGDGHPTCRTCAGIELDLDCRGCGREQELHRRGLCWSCYLTENVAELLADPAGAVPAELKPLATALATMANPRNGLVWIKQPRVAALLRGLATGRVPLDHAGLDALPPSRTVEYLRGLLVEHGVLERRDRHLADYDRWLRRQLTEVDDEDDRRLLERFGRWHQLRRLREQARAAPVSTEAFLRTKQHTTVARQFLAWLRSADVDLGDLTQTHIDQWYADGPTTRGHVESFLYWALKHRLINGITVPDRDRADRSAFGEDDRIAAIRRILLDQTTPQQTRVIAGLVLLFGQPVNRLAKLTLSDLRVATTSVEIKLGSSWIGVPEPFATLLAAHAAGRPNCFTAANPDSQWLFPGVMPGDHLNPVAIAKLLRRHGVPPRAARTTTWHHLLRQVPPAVLADALGISPITAARHASLAAAPYSRYAAPTDRGGPLSPSGISPCHHER